MATVDYRSVLKTAEAFTDDETPWDQKFRNLVEKSIKEQADAFKLRFALQFENQGLDAREMVAQVNAAADLFTEKSKEGNGKSLKYAGVEFGDVLKEFSSAKTMTFVERKKNFKDFDLDENGYVDLVEFLMFLHKDTVLQGYLERHGLDALDTETEAEALIKEFVNIGVLIDKKLDENVLGLAKLKQKYEADVKEMKAGAVKEIQKRQLTNNLKQREKKYEEEQKAFMSKDQLGKAKAKLLKTQEKHLRALEESLKKEAEDALKPKKNLKIPGK